MEVCISDPAGSEAAALVDEFFAEIATRYPGFDPSLQPPAPVDAFAAPRGGAFLIARVDDTAVGCAGLQRLDEETAELRRVFVREEVRGRGVARALLSTVIEVARDLGYTRIRLDTGDRLHEAQALFRALGFREIHDYNGNPLAALWMELPLPADDVSSSEGRTG